LGYTFAFALAIRILYNVHKLMELLILCIMSLALWYHITD